MSVNRVAVNRMRSLFGVSTIENGFDERAFDETDGRLMMTGMARRRGRNGTLDGCTDVRGCHRGT